MPKNLEGCHAAFIGDYVVSGHVPIEVVQKMLAEKPDIAGVTLPGMPAGSPGMGGDKTEPFTVYAFKKGGAAPTVYVTRKVAGIEVTAGSLGLGQRQPVNRLSRYVTREGLTLAADLARGNTPSEAIRRNAASTFSGGTLAPWSSHHVSTAMYAPVKYWIAISRGTPESLS